MSESNIPLYGVICHEGGQWTVEYYAEINYNKKGVRTSTVTGRYSGYGNFPYEKYPQLPVIDLTNTDLKTVFKVINIPDNLRPKEENPLFNTGNLNSYLSTVRDMGVPIINDIVEGDF